MPHGEEEGVVQHRAVLRHRQAVVRIVSAVGRRRRRPRADGEGAHEVLQPVDRVVDDADHRAGRGLDEADAAAEHL